MKLVALLVLGGVGTLTPAPVDAAPPTPPEPAPDADAGLHVDDQDFGVSAGGTWTARLTVEDPAGAIDAAAAEPASGTTTAGTTTTGTTTTGTIIGNGASTTTTAGPGPGVVDGTVTVAIRSRADERGELGRLLAGDLSPTSDELELPLADVLVRRSGSDHLELAVPISERSRRDTVTARRPGIYPVTITVEVAGDELAETTTLIQVLPAEPTGNPSLGIAVAAALSEPGPEPDPARLDRARDELAELVEFGEQTSASLSLAFPPSLATLLAEDEALRDGTRAALESAELLAQPYLALDPSAAVAVDRAESFSTEVRRGEDALSRVLPGVVSRRAAWLVRDPLSQAAAATLRDPLGYRLLVVDQMTYESMPGNISTFLDASLSVDIDLGGGATMQGAVVSPFGSMLGDGRAGGRTPAETAVEILAQLLVNRDELGPELRRNVVLATAGFTIPDGATVAALERLLAGNPDAHLTTVSGLVGTTDRMAVGSEPVTLELPAQAGPDLSARVQQLDLVRVSAESAASMLPDDEQRTRWLTELDALLSTGYTDEDVTTRVDRITGEIDAVRSSVEPPEPFTFTLTGRDQTLRLNIRNTADDDRTIIVRAISNKLRFPGGDQEVTLPPGVSEVAIPVEARANGTSSVEIQLLTPVFQQRIGPSSFLEARVNAISGLGQTITGIALVLLLTWWFSHFHRRRRARLAAMVVVDEYDPGPTVSPDAAEAAVVPAGPAGSDGSATEDR